MKQQIAMYPLRFWLNIALLMMSTTALAVGPKLHQFDYGIISSVINHGVNDGAANIIVDETTTGAVINIAEPSQSIDDLARELGTTAAALREWTRNNSRRYILQEKLAIAGDYHLLAQTERSTIFNDEDPAVNWRQFRVRFPRAAGIIRVSRPGIDDTAKTAILYLEYECGAHCGSGRLVNLVQTDSGEWRVTTGALVWITSPQ